MELRDGENVQCLGSSDALPEDPSSNSCSLIGIIPTTRKCRFRRSEIILWPLCAPAIRFTLPHSDVHIIRSKIKFYDCNLRTPLCLLIKCLVER